MHTYLSTHLLVHVPTDPPENKSTQTHPKINLPIHLGAISFRLTTKVFVCFLRAVNEDSISRSMTRKTQLPGSQMYLFINLPVHFDAFIPNNRKDLPIHSPNVLHIIYLSMSMPPWSRLLAPGVFKPSCSTPFTLFLHLVSFYRSFQLYFIPKTIHDTSVFSFLLTAYFYLTGHSPVFIYNSSSYSSSWFLRSPSDPAYLPYAAARVGGEWDPGG